MTNVWCSNDSFGTLSATCTCASTMPGSTVAFVRSIVRTPGGIATFAPTSAMRSPRTSTTWFVSIEPLRASNRRPARIAVTDSCADTVVSDIAASAHAAILLNLQNPWNFWNFELNIVASDVDDEVARHCGADVLRVVQLVGADDADVARTEPIGLAGDRQF